MDNNEKILKDKAYNLHIQGKFDEARAIYEEILNNNPDNLSVSFLYANLLNNVKEYDKAIEYYNKVYAVTKSDDIKQNIIMAYYNSGNYAKAAEEAETVNNITVDLLKLKANIYLKLNDFPNAIKTFNALYEADNTDISALFNISILYKEIQDYNSAYEYALKAYNQAKDNINIILNIAELCENLDKKDELVFYLKEAEKQDSDNEQLLLKLGFISEDIYRFQDALMYYTKILNINENNYIATIKIAMLYLKIRDIKNALAYIHKAEKIDPENYYNILAYCQYYEIQDDYDALLIYAQKLMQKDNNNENSYSHLYEAYFWNFDYESALKCCEEAISKNLDITDNICRKAVCLNLLGRTDEALNVLDNYKDENSFTYKKIHSSVNLTNKRYEEGMKYYSYIVSPVINEKMKQEENQKVSFLDKKFFEYYKKVWKREDLTDKTLLIYQGPHGLGDYLMFTRYIPLLEKMAGKVVIEVLPNFYDLFKYNFKNSTVVQETDKPYSDFDYSASCMDIFYGMNMGLDNIPFPEGWLSIPEEIINSIRNLPDFKTDKKKVGIFWQGSKDTMMHRMAKLEDFIPLFSLSNCKFYSVDVSEQDESMLKIFDEYDIVNCKRYINNAMNTAAILKNLDVLVTVDSFPLHLAGSLGVKANLMLPGNSEWRWLKDSKKTIWYNSVNMFKQTDRFGWKDVILRIKEDLKS
jgi:tetratricopeptide (TPR) repeat protein